MVEIKFKNGSYIKTIPNNDCYRSKHSDEQWEYLEQNPDKFVEEFCGWELFPYQKLLLKLLTSKDIK